LLLKVTSLPLALTERGKIRRRRVLSKGERGKEEHFSPFPKDGKDLGRVFLREKKEKGCHRKKEPFHT